MKRELLDSIICPSCRSSIFDLEEAEVDGQDIRKGSVACKNCSKRYGISGGIIHLYDKLSPEAESEIRSIENEIGSSEGVLSFQDEAWLLDYPDNEKLGVDQRSDKIMRFIAENSIRTIERLKLSGQHILEIGASNCWLTARLAENNKCIAMDTFTKQPKGLECGEIFIRKNNRYFERVASDMANIPFKDKIFDSVVISSSLHHSSDLSKTLIGISRVLKDDGKLILMNEPSTGKSGTQERAQVMKDNESGVNEKRYSMDDWKTAFSSAGFTYQIRLPENFNDVILSRGGIYAFIGNMFSKFPDRMQESAKACISNVVYIMFDGFFNAILNKSKP